MSDDFSNDHDNVIALRPRSTGDAGDTIDDAAAQDSDSAHVDAELARLSGQAASDAPLEHQVEALLFISPVALTTEALSEATDQHVDDMHDCLVDMMGEYATGKRGIVLERVAGGWAFRASDACRESLTRLMRPQGDTKLTPSALETLAVVAYLQPVSRPDVARIRGVAVDAAVSGLLDRGFIEEAGRGDTGAVLFRTTTLFERAFGLSSLGALPELEGFGPGEEEVVRLREQLEQMAAARVE